MLEAQHKASLRDDRERAFAAAPRAYLDALSSEPGSLRSAALAPSLHRARPQPARAAARPSQGSPAIVVAARPAHPPLQSQQPASPKAPRNKRAASSATAPGA